MKVFNLYLQLLSTQMNSQITALLILISSGEKKEDSSVITNSVKNEKK